MPDNEDYRDLGKLLATVNAWTEADAETARSFLAAQLDAVASSQPKDLARRDSMTAVANDLRDAIARWEAER